MPLTWMNESYDPFLHRARWKLMFAWRPHRCYFSKQWIWFKLGYRGTAIWTGPGEPVFETKWVTKEEFLVATLKGTIC